MASFLLPRSRPLFSLTLGLGLSSVYATQTLYRQKPLLCEASAAKPMTTISDSFKTYSQDAKVPVFKHGRPNPQAYGQISAGSIAGTFGNPSLECVCWEDGGLWVGAAGTRMNIKKSWTGVWLMRW